MASTYPDSAMGSASALQALTRQQRRFHEIEAALPSVGTGAALSLRAPAVPQTLTSLSAWTSAARASQPLIQAVSEASASSSRVSDLLSFLGPRNPAPRAVTGEDSVWLLDNVAYQDAATGQWRAEYVVAVMAQHPTCGVVEAARSVADKLRPGEDAHAEARDDAMLATIQARITPFLQDILPGRQVRALHGRDWPLVFSPGGRNGLSSDSQQLPASALGALVPTRAQVPPGANGMLEMHTFFADPHGWGVISDIDDTIKVTQTSDPIGILRTTFVETPTPVAGMPELYRALHARLGAGAPFFYLSASPYNLYPFLQGFRSQYFPPGALVLRDAALMSVAGLLSTLTEGTQAYKVDRMHKIHGWLPRKSFVCIGDSTQSDPEAYGEVYRAFPGWVKLILIRKVTDIAALGIAEKNEPARFDKAFEGVPKSVWHVFEDPVECYAHVKAVVGEW